MMKNRAIIQPNAKTRRHRHTLIVRLSQTSHLLHIQQAESVSTQDVLLDLPNDEPCSELDTVDVQEETPDKIEPSPETETVRFDNGGGRV